MPSPPDAFLIASPGCAVEPLVHSPQTIQPAGVCRICVVDDAVLEAFNVFNNPVWGDPNLSIANPTLFGTINTTRTPMRELQIGAKFSF